MNYRDAFWHSFWHDRRYFCALVWAEIELRYGLYCGKIGEWFLWQQWKQCVDREEFEKALKRLGGM